MLSRPGDGLALCLQFAAAKACCRSIMLSRPGEAPDKQHISDRRESMAHGDLLLLPLQQPQSRSLRARLRLQ